MFCNGICFNHVCVTSLFYGPTRNCDLRLTLFLYVFKHTSNYLHDVYAM